MDTTTFRGVLVDPEILHFCYGTRNNGSFNFSLQRQYKNKSISRLGRDYQNGIQMGFEPCPQRISNVQGFEVTAIPMKWIGLKPLGHCSRFFDPPNSYIDVNVLLQRHAVKYLSIFIDNNLKWSSYIHHLSLQLARYMQAYFIKLQI